MKATMRVLSVALLLVVAGFAPATAQTLHRYWADLQGDNATAGTAADYYAFGRDSVALDVVALTPHASNATATRWANVKSAAAAYNAPGSFVAFSGWEWNSDTYGHKVAYFLTDDQTIIKPNDPASNHPNEFYSLFSATNGLTHAAHPSLASVTTNWDFFDKDLQPNVEIVSTWGEYETAANGKAVRNVWSRGYRVGVLGASDSHLRPGSEGGLTAILAPTLNREAILDALRSHRTYATNGPRIGLEFSIWGNTFGDVVNDVFGDPPIYARVEGTAPLARVEVRRSNTLVYTYTPLPKRVFVEVGAPLTYFKGQSEPAAGWNTLAFNDASWLPGRSGIGFGDNDDVTVVTGMLNNYWTLYTRQLFTVTDMAPQYLYLGCDYDDGFIAYIDGVEVLRANMPTGPVTSTTPAGPFREPNLAAMAVVGAVAPPYYTDNGLASGTPRNPTLDLFDLSAYAAMLGPGPHVLAIEVHNSLVSSNDLSLIPRLYEIDPMTTATINWTDTGASGDRFYDVKVIQIDGGTAWSTPIWLNPDAPPRPIATLMDTPADNGTSLELTWTKSVAQDFSHYNIFVSESPFTDAGGMTPWNPAPIKNADSLAARFDTFNGEPLVRGRLYYVYVGAIDQAGKMNTSTIGASTNAAPSDNIAPSAPASISVADTPQDDGGSLQVTWSLSADDGAGLRDVARYEIFRRRTTSSYGTTPLATRPAGTTLFSDNTVTDGLTYMYKVRAHDGFNPSAFTIEFGPITSIDNGGLAEPKNVAASDRPADQGGWIRVTWSLIAEDASITRYNVFRTTTPGLYPPARLGWVPRGTAIFNDSTAADGADYYYVVQSDSAGVQKSTFSAEVGPVRALDNVAPATVTTLTATNTFQGGTVRLDWTGYDELAQGDVAGYNLYYKTSGISSVSTLTPVLTVPAGTFAADVDGLVNNTGYYFAVTPFDEAENQINSVIDKFAKPTDTAPPVFAGLESATPGDASLTLAWSPAQDNTYPITYKLYQALTPSGFNYSTPTATIPGTTPIVALGSSWRFLKGTSAPPALWKDRNFDDSGWLAGEGAFGYDDNNVYKPATILSDMNGIYTSVYFRANFTLTSIPQALVLGVLADDGYIAYLNGVEVARYNLDDPANYYSLAEKGTGVAWNAVLDPASPTNYNPNPALRLIDISSATGLLVAGRNTLSFQVHNFKKSNPDFLFLAELSAANVRHTLTGLSPSQTYYYVMHVADGSGNSSANSVVVSGTPLQAPPPAPVSGLSAVKSGSSVVLRWTPVSIDSVGSFLVPDHYNVYSSTDPSFIADTATHTNLLGSTTSASFTHAGALGDMTATFYRVYAVSATGRESWAPSALAQKTPLGQTWTAGQENVYWIAIPYVSGIPDAQTLINDLNRGPMPGPVRRISRLDPATQALQSLTFEFGAWTGDNFPIVAGESYAITLQSNLSQALVGAHNPTLGLNLGFRTDRSNIYWLGLPWNAAYADAQSLLDHMNGGSMPGSVAKIVSFDANGTPQSHLYFAGQWLGPNFTLSPGRGYAIVLRGDLQGWRPQVTR